MGIHLITGGSASGKSAYAEAWITKAAKDRPLCYLATMRPWGEEARARIRRHRKMRQGKGFSTLECPCGLKDLKVPEGSGILLECLTNLTANELYGEDGQMRDPESVAEEILEGIRILASRAFVLVVVTGEVCSDGNRYTPETEAYQKLLGELNRRIAREADRVTEVVYGIPVVVKEDETSVEQL